MPMHKPATRRLAVITGAYGGMGKAIARAFGADMDLLLTGNRQSATDAFTAELREEGYTVAASVGGSLADDATFGAIGDALAGAGPFGALIHTAGVSTAQCEWQDIIRINLVATEMLLRTIEPALVPGSVAVLVSSMGGHMAASVPELDAVLAEPLAPDLLKKAEPLMAPLCIPGDPYGLRTTAYLAAKREMIRMCERRAGEWGSRGSRIVSISPGMIWTPMARREVAENEMPAATLEATPVGRWGTPMDIAAAARFLASDAAGFISGCDLRIDGGVTPHMYGPLF